MSALSILAEECELLNDSKYRGYITQVDKALKSFDNTSEWADLISALGKLNKVLLAHVKYPVIPKRVTIGKRLAQCLHPALPSGVHMKALETYDIIFKCIGTERLAQDLFIYSAGLFPLLSYAAMNVKPVLLIIYERHFVSLGKRIKPGLNGLLLGLLPGLEEGSEHYDHANSLLDDFCEVTEPSYFYTCVWECIHSCPSVRLPAVTYLLTHYNKKQTMEDQLHMIGLNISLMIEAICNCVQDASVLVQRSLLDFLILAFPLHNSQLTRADMAKIVKGSANVLLRRDMSLNRRFYAWLLGTSPTTSSAHAQMLELRSKGDKCIDGSEEELSYFDEFSKELLVQALKNKLGEKVDISSPGGKTSVLKPFRILISLLDKPEIGPVILENVLLSIFRCLHREFENSKLYKGLHSREKKVKGDSSDKVSAYDELLKTANLLFGTFEPYFIWDYVSRMFEQSCRHYCENQTKTQAGSSLSRKNSTLSRQGSMYEILDQVTVGELCQLVSFLLEIVSLETFSETQTDHLPNLLCNIITCLTEHCGVLTDSDIIVTLQLCTNILSKVQPTMTTSGSHDMSADVSHDQTVEGEVSSIGRPVTQSLSLEEAVEMNNKLKTETEEQRADNSDTNLPEKSRNGDKKKGQQIDDNEKMVVQTEQKKNVSNKDHQPEPNKKPLSRNNSKQGHSTNMMQNCIECFQNFFHTTVTLKLFGDDRIARRCFQSLLLNSDLADSCNTLDKDSCIDSESEFSYDDRFSEDGTCVSMGNRISINHVEEEWLKTFSAACQLLVEFASFPMYGQDVRRQEKHSKDEDQLPCWVQDLVTCCCHVDSYQIQSAAISTMMDLIILTQSVQVESNPTSHHNTGNQSSQGGPVSIQILPTLHHSDLQVLEEQTNFYKMSACILWSYLGDTTPQYQQLAVKLLHILHQVSPSSWVCENVIGNQLISDDEKVRINAFKKFSVLWHLTRNKKSGIIPGKPLRTFDRSMFVVLDSLKEDASPVRSLAVTWLTHVIHQGDLGRIMEPLLLMLLHPDTARVSIQHVNIHKPRKVRLSECSEDNSEANIYAISSEGGNIIYHVNPAKANPRGHVQEDLKSYALTVLGSTGTKTAPVRAQSEQELHFEKVDPNNLSLRINPFGSENSLDKLIYGGFEPPTSSLVYERAKRLDRETCKKEGISFVEKDESTQGDDAEEELKMINLGKLSDSRSSMSMSCDSIIDSPEDIVRNVLESLIQEVVPDDPAVSLPLSGRDTAGSSGSLTSSQIEIRKPLMLPAITRTDSLTSSNPDNDLLNSMTKSGSGIDSPTPSEQNVSIFQDIGQGDDKETTDIHTLHMHILLYAHKYDVQRTLYALSTLKAMLVACPRMTVTSLVTTNISSLRAPQLAKLQLLLARHRKSVFGKNFFGEIPSDVMSNYRSSMFIEILMQVCLYFMRGYYPNLMMSKLSTDDLLGNKEVHIMATEILTLMLSDVVNIMRDSGKNFVSYISDLLQRCKVQKALLHCMLAVIYNNRKRKEDENVSKITEAIISFNEEDLEPAANEAFQIKLLDVLLVMIKLEDQVNKIQGQGYLEPSSESDWNRLRISYQSTLNNIKYNLGHPVVQQGMFVSGVLSALKQYHMCHMHQHWIALITAALPYMGKYLPGIVMMVVSQLCRNIEALAGEYERDGRARSNRPLEKIPADHVVTMLDGLMTLCHYCLLDSVSPVAIGQPTPSGAVAGHSALGSANILTNLFHVFNPVGVGKEASTQRDPGTVSPVMDARSNILSVMPRITACLASLWRAVNIIETREESPTLTMGSPKVVRQYILEFLSPISLPHGTHLLGAIAVAWNDRRKKNGNFKNNKKVLPIPCEDQLLLVDLVEAIKVLPMDTLIQTVKQVLKQPPSSELSRGKRNLPLEVNLLQFFYSYVEKAPVSQLVDSWPALLSLLREALTLTLIPPGQFLLLLILNEFVQKTPAMKEKKTQKELQEITQRLMEAVSIVAGACLEQTAWLKKNYAVKPGVQAEELEGEEGNQEEDEPVIKERRVMDPEPSNTSSIDAKYSVQGLTLLAELTAPMLDVIYSSDEKDKVAPFLTTLLYNVFPYLKSHSSNNLPSLRAGSQFLASISSYQYTRKAWRREALELLLDPSFFQTDMTSITCWLTVVDNLMTHDKTTYKDLMARVSMTQSASLNLFSNKEQEIDQKACMLKRLAFTVFCSEPDQYQKNIPEIQEKLAESLRVLQAPSVMAQVFNCFRVLLLRVSPQHLTSMWPTIITELIHVFLQIEQELSSETEEFILLHIKMHSTQVQRIAALDSSWAHLGNGLNAHNNPSWLQLYLSACKLLDLCLALPADMVPQFQLYRWAFIGGAAAGEAEDDMDEEDEVTRKRKEAYRQQACFKPHIIRLARLLNTKMQSDVPVMKMTPGRPLLTICYLRSLAELQPFFNTLCLANQTDNLLLAAKQLGPNNNNKNQSGQMTNGHSGPKIAHQSERTYGKTGRMPKSKSAPLIDPNQSVLADFSSDIQAKTNKQFIEEILKRDFLEPMS